MTQSQSKYADDKSRELLTTCQQQKGITLCSSTKLTEDQRRNLSELRLKSYTPSRKSKSSNREYDTLRSVVNKDSLHKKVKKPTENIEDQTDKSTFLGNIIDHDTIDLLDSNEIPGFQSMKKQEFNNQKYVFLKHSYINKHKETPSVKIVPHNYQSLSTMNTAKTILTTYGQHSPSSPQPSQKKRVRIKSLIKMSDISIAQPLPIKTPVKRRGDSIVIKSFENHSMKD